MKRDISIDIIEDAVQKMAESIMEDKFLSNAAIVERLKIFIPSALFALLQEAVTPLETEALALKAELSEGKYDYDNKIRMNKMFKLGKINDEIKHNNRAVHAVLDYCEYKALRFWVIQEFGEKKLNEFNSLQISERTKLMKSHIGIRKKQLINNKDRPNEIIYSTGSKVLENEKLKR